MVRAIDTSLLAYAQIVLSRSRLAGFFLLMATACDLRSFVFGAVALAVAALAVRLLSIEAPAIDGPYGYNAVLLGLGIAHTFGATPRTLVFTVILAVACVITTAFFCAWLGRTWGLPVLSFPFVAVFTLALGAAPYCGLIPLLDASPPPDSAVGGLLAGLGNIVFLPRLESGILVALALLVHSRIATLLAAMACALSSLFFAEAAVPTGLLPVLVMNPALTAMAIGGIWFVPSTASFAVALASAFLCMLISLGLFAPLAQMGIPLLVLPFNVSVAIVLSAMRQRGRDEAPKSVDFAAGSPEENLLYYQTNQLRLLGPKRVSFRLPFRGVWTCTQGNSGDVTHKGLWRHAYDFEVRDDAGSYFSGDGERVESYHCFRLPVLAAADGTVVKVEDTIADNAVGGMNLQRNWGNFVLLYHAPGVYSLVAHLAKQSALVREGQFVKRGEVLGLSGSSGRSPRPHLHFQVQAGPALGAPTVPCTFDDVLVRAGDADLWLREATPEVGDSVQNPLPNPELASYLMPAPGETSVFRTGEHTETVTCEVDLWGRHLLKSTRSSAYLYFGVSDATFTVYDAGATGPSVLLLLRAALSRVPLEHRASVRWRDHLPHGFGGPRLTLVLWDFVAPFLGGRSLEMEYTSSLEGGTWIVRGESLAKNRKRKPLLQTRVHLVQGVGPVFIELEGSRFRGRVERVELVRESKKVGPTHEGGPWSPKPPSGTPSSRGKVVRLDPSTAGGSVERERDRPTRARAGEAR